MTKRIVVKGAVQGIGYRPFISEKATEYGLSGYVKNLGAAVEILVSGDDLSVESFITMLSKQVPAGGFVLGVETEELSADQLTDTGADFDKLKGSNFTIVESSALDLSSQLPVFLPDIGICDDCMEEMLDPLNRRYRYPLISCAVCGPRMSILNALPYDRDNTTMEDFEMCPCCRKDYGIGRRKYAQTISCHDCGPQMIIRLPQKATEAFNTLDLDTRIAELGSGEESVLKAIELLKEGKIIGLKGISGYQLVCKPEAKVAERLRRVKGRENKPFAIMFSTVSDIRHFAFVSKLEEELLKSSARPIVLVKSKAPSLDLQVSDKKLKAYEQGFPWEVLKGSRYIGAFLPSAGIHRLLADALGPLIVTSANKSDEPMIIDDDRFISVFMPPESLKTDGDNRDGAYRCVDAVLYHKRRINMAQDDSVMFVISADEKEYPQFVRRARGFAPLPIFIDEPKEGTSGQSGSKVLAFGGDLKSSFSFGKGDRIIPSQYIGDLKDYETNKSYKKLLQEYKSIFEFEPDLIISDLHPLYISTQMAGDMATKDGIRHIGLQHHFAHTYSVMAENNLQSSLGVSFDGTGFGLDGRIWGGEFVYCKGAKPYRIGNLSYVKLTGGDESPKNAGKISRCYIHECQKRGLIKQPVIEVDSDTKLLAAALDKSINTYETSSMGRLFDAVSALLGICQYNSYEGECAIMLEKEALEFEASNEKDYPVFKFTYLPEPDIIVIPDGTEKKEPGQNPFDSFTADQIALFSEIYRCFTTGKYPVPAIAYGFHMAIAELIINGCSMMEQQTKEQKVCLSGGVFNNRLLLACAAKALLAEGFEVYWNQKVPLGDGGISTGQAYFGLLNDKE